MSIRKPRLKSINSFLVSKKVSLFAIHCDTSQVSDYLTLHIHRTTSSRRRVWYPGGSNCVLTGAYTNNQHILIRYDVEGPSDKHLSIVLSQYKKSTDLCYTLSVSQFRFAVALTTCWNIFTFAAIR